MTKEEIIKAFKEAGQLDFPRWLEVTNYIAYVLSAITLLAYLFYYRKRDINLFGKWLCL